MAIRTFNSVGGFSVGEVPVTIVANGTGGNANVISINNVDFANVSNTVVVGNSTSNVTILKSGDLTATGNLTSNTLTDTRITFAGTNGILKDSANLTFNTTGNVLALKGTANIANDSGNYVTMYGANGAIISSGDANLAGGALTVTTAGDVAVANTFVVGKDSGNLTDSAFYVDASGNFSIKVGGPTGTTVFSVDASTGNVTTTGSVSGAVAGTIAAPGTDTQILFNDAGNVGADANLTFFKGNSTVSANFAVTGDIYASNTLTVDSYAQFNNDIYIDGGNISSPGYVVFQGGGYIYDNAGNDGNTVIIHADATGYAQMEYSGDQRVYVDTDGVHMETAAGGNINIDNNDGNITLTVAGNTWYFNSDNSLSVPGNIDATQGNIFVGNLANVGQLNVVGTSELHGDATLDGNITVDGISTLYGDVTVGIVDDPATANLIVSGDTYLHGDAQVFGDTYLNHLSLSGYLKTHLIPEGNAALDLGNATHRFRDLWLSGYSIQLGNTSITSNGSNTMVVGNAIIGYPGSWGGNTYPMGNLQAGIFTTAGSANIGNTANTADLFVSGVTSMGNGTINATSTTTGTLKVNGGVGVTGNIYVGSNANIAGNVLIEGANVDISNGNLHVQSNANIHGDVIVGGNLTVSGTTTYVNTTNSSLKDALIDIGGDGAGGNAPNSADGLDRGLVLHSYDGAAVNQFIGWKTSASEFQILTNVSETGGVVTGDLANLELDTLYTTNLYGTLQTADQPNVANMSGLFDIAVSNVANIANANITTSLTIGELSFPILDYSSTINDNEIISLTTDGAGQLGFTVIHTDRISNTLSGSQIFVDGSDDSGNITFTVNGTTTPLVVTENGANVTGDFDVTGLLSAGSLNVGSLTPESIALGNTAIYANTATLTNTTQHVIAEASVSEGGAVEFFVKGTANVSGVWHSTVATITAIYFGDGANVDFATYGKLHVGSGAGTFDVNYAGGNIQLLATNTQSVDTVWTAQIRTI